MALSNINGSLRHRAVRGVSWGALSQVLAQSFAWVISFVLARILGPNAYGLIAMTTVFTGFAGLFGNMGLGEAIVQRKHLERRHKDTAFWLNTTAGVAITVTAIAIAPLIAWFYHEPLLRWIMSAIAVQFTLDALNVVQRAVLSREMRFRDLGIVRMITTVVAGSIGLAMAFTGFNVWSLVGQTLAGSLMQLLLYWKIAAWRPSWYFERMACRELLGFGSPILAFNIVNYWARNADNLLIGRFVGSRALGVYSRAYSLMLLPLSQVSVIVGRVMIPTLSLIQDNKERVKQTYLKTIGVISLITFPIMAGLFVTADHVVIALLGPRWADVVPVLKILALPGAIGSVVATVGWIYQSQGKTRLYFAMGLINSVVYVIGFAIGVHWGVIGVAWSYMFVVLIICYPTLAIPTSLIGSSASEVGRTITPPFVCAIGMAAIVWVTERALPGGMSHWFHLTVEVPLACFIYALSATLWKLDAWREVKSTFLSALSRSTNQDGGLGTVSDTNVEETIT